MNNYKRDVLVFLNSLEKPFNFTDPSPVMEKK